MTDTIDKTLMNDKISKKLFIGDDIGKELSATVIAEVLHLDEKEVFDNLEYEHPLASDNINTVDSETDLKYDANKLIINIEINSSIGPNIKVKNETYVCQLYLKQLKNHKDYNKLKPVIQINIDNYDYFHANEFIYKSMLMETSLHLVDNEHIEIYHINLPFLRKMDYNRLRTDEDRLKKIMYMFVCRDKEKLRKLYEGDELMSEVMNKADKLSEALDELLYYNKEELERLDREILLKDALEEGIEQGTKQRNIEIAKNMLAKAVEIKMISEFTGLTVDEIKTIKE